MKKNTSIKNDTMLHAKILVGAVIAGLFVAGCSPMRRSEKVMSPSQTPQEMTYTSPAPTPDLTDTDYDKDVMELDAALKTTNPTDLNGSDL